MQRVRLRLLRLLVALAFAIVGTQAATNVALVFNQNGQLTTSSTLVWQSYTGDDKQLEYAVPAGQYQLDAEHTHPMLVCRAPAEGLIITGHTSLHAGGKTVCIVSMHMEVRTHHAFDVLLNKAHGAKLTWRPWKMYDAATPIGAVSAVSASHVSAAADDGGIVYQRQRLLRFADGRLVCGAPSDAWQR